MRVSHSEILCPVNGSVAFSAAQTLAVNPGLAATFPWLSGLGHRFESYKFLKLKLKFFPAKGQHDGEVGAVIDFDAADAAPASYMTAMQYSGAIIGPSWTYWEKEMSQINLKKFSLDRYNRGGAVPANTDVKTYDLGNIFIITQGHADTSLIGHLWADYVVEFTSAEIAAGF